VIDVEINTKYSGCKMWENKKGTPPAYECWKMDHLCAANHEDS